MWQRPFGGKVQRTLKLRRQPRAARLDDNGKQRPPKGGRLLPTETKALSSGDHASQVTLAHFLDHLVPLSRHAQEPVLWAFFAVLMGPVNQ
jgi:hypothetical protein